MGDINKIPFDTTKAAKSAVAALAGISAAQYFTPGGLNIGTPELAAAGAAGLAYSYFFLPNMVKAGTSTTDATKLAQAINMVYYTTAAEAGLVAGGVFMGAFGFQMMDAGILGLAAGAGMAALSMTSYA